MEINEIIAENIVNRLSAIIKKKITIANTDGQVLASTELSQTGKVYDQLRQAVTEKKNLEITSSTKNGLAQGLAVPIKYTNTVIGSVFIEDRPEDYQKYRQFLAATVELLINQNITIDNFPYKDKIKDNFVFGLLHRRLSVEDGKVREEAEMFDVNLNRDKVVVIINIEGFWQGIFSQNLTASEDEKQTVLSEYKKKIFQAFSTFFGRLSGCSVSYFGSDTFVVLLDELYSMEGREMMDQIRAKSEELYVLIAGLLEPESFSRILIGVSSFYRGKDGAIVAYEEARRAMNLGLALGMERKMYHIDDLGMIATLVGGNKKWQDNFVRRILTKLMAEEYLLETVEVFFDNDMSLTQTSKKLSIHRNTLLYRLDKIKKVTGLDPRKFNDALELKVALILNRVLYTDKGLVKQI